MHNRKIVLGFAKHIRENMGTFAQLFPAFSQNTATFSGFFPPFFPPPFRCTHQPQGLATALRFLGIADHALLCICHLPTVG